MKFLNALAWVLFVWSVLALLLPVVFIAAEKNPVILIARQMHYGKHFNYRAAMLVVAVLWLMFG